MTCKYIFTVNVQSDLSVGEARMIHSSWRNLHNPDHRAEKESVTE